MIQMFSCGKKRYFLIISLSNGWMKRLRDMGGFNWGIEQDSANCLRSLRRYICHERDGRSW